MRASAGGTKKKIINVRCGVTGGSKFTFTQLVERTCHVVHHVFLSFFLFIFIQMHYRPLRGDWCVLIVLLPHAITRCVLIKNDMNTTNIMEEHLDNNNG